MSVLQREPSQTDKARLYVTTEREILQTGPSSAQFQNGRYSFVLADGVVPDTDGDLDGYTDVYEDRTGSDRDNPFIIPLDGEGNPLPPDAVTYPTLVLGNGDLIRIADSTTLTNRGVFIDPKRGNNIVRIIAAPASTMQRAKNLFDFSGDFLFINPNTGLTEQFPLALYYFERDFPNPQDVGAFESEIVPGGYQIEYPTIANRPLGRGGVTVAHRLVPNGSLTKDLKRPTWLIRSLKNDQKVGKPPVVAPWVGGRLQFDPYLPIELTWDNLAGLVTPLEFIDIFVVDEDGFPLSLRYRIRATDTGFRMDMSSIMRLLFGNIRDLRGSPPLALDGNIVMRYVRLASGQPTADLSTVTVIVPARMQLSFAAWRLDWFPQDLANDSISGPNADPDGDGLTNFQEYLLGSDPTVPTVGVTNQFSTNVTVNSATLGGTVVSDPFSAANPVIFERGIVYSATSTNSLPFIDGAGVNRVQAPPADLGDFTVNVTGLASGTRYSYRGYVISSAGTTYSPVSTFTTAALPQITLPSVTSPTSASVTVDSAVLGGTVADNGGSPITGTGVVFSVASTNDNPFVGGANVIQITGPSVNTGPFTVNITDLAPGTTYVFRAYAINSFGTSHTAQIGTFTTPLPPGPPTIESPTVANVSDSSATLGGNVTSEGGAPVFYRGVVFSFTQNNGQPVPPPVINGTGVSTFGASSAGPGVFTVNATGLAPGREYQFRAFATNSVGTTYTDVETFTTSGASGTVPTVTSPTITSLSSISATLGANVTNQGQSAILERGFVYSQTSVNNNPVEGGSGVTKVTAPPPGTGVYSAEISGLLPNTGYTFRAFATNSAGTAYASPIAFFTTFPPLTVTSPTVADITSTSATLGGTVQSDGATTVTNRGVVYTQNPGVPPVLGDPGVTQVTGPGTMGVFTVDVPNLDPDTTYFFRAYATNNAGTSYSAVLSFRTLPMQLLGMSVIEWVEPGEEVQEAAEPLIQEAAATATRSPRGVRTSDGVTPLDDGGGPGQAPDRAFIPRFLYHKHQSEVAAPMSYVVESSPDSINWERLDENLWQIDYTAETIRATWISPDPAPPRMFFRVKGTLD